MIVEELGHLRRNLCRGCGEREINEETLYCDICKENAESADQSRQAAVESTGRMS